MAEMRFDISEIVNRAVDKLIESGWRPAEWIPCSERMPENCTKVLVWFEYFRYGEYNCMYSTWGIGEYFDFSGRWLIDDSTGWQDLHVFAWMPLPDPPEVNENA